MREQGKFNKIRFFVLLFVGAIFGAIILGAISYLVVLPRGGDASLPIWIGACFGAIFGGPLLATNLEKEK